MEKWPCSLVVLKSPSIDTCRNIRLAKSQAVALDHLCAEVHGMNVDAKEGAWYPIMLRDISVSAPWQFPKGMLKTDYSYNVATGGPLGRYTIGMTIMRWDNAPGIVTYVANRLYLYYNSTCIDYRYHAVNSATLWDLLHPHESRSVIGYGTDLADIISSGRILDNADIPKFSSKDPDVGFFFMAGDVSVT